MSTAAMTVGLRPRSRLGPALRRVHIPFGPLALSAFAPGALAAALVVAAFLWPAPKTKTYIVNLVPAVAAVGAPQGRPTPAEPPRVATPVREEAPKPRELPPPRETSRELPPPRETSRELPPPRASAALPDRELPTRAAALPRAGDKESPPPPTVAATRPTAVSTPVK